MPAPGDGADNDGTGPGSNNSSNSSRSSPSRSSPSRSRNYGPSPATQRSGTPSRTPSRSPTSGEYGGYGTPGSGIGPGSPGRSGGSPSKSQSNSGNETSLLGRAQRTSVPTRGMNIEAMRQQAMMQAAAPALIGLINPLAGLIAGAFLGMEDDYGYENPGLMGFFDGSFARNVVHEPGKAPYSLDTPPGDPTRGGEAPPTPPAEPPGPSTEEKEEEPKTILDLLNELHQVDTTDLMQRLRESLMAQDDTEDKQTPESQNPITANAALDFKDLQARQELVRQRIANHQKLFNTVR